MEYSNEYFDKKITNDVIEEVKNYKTIPFQNENFIQINLILKAKTIDLKLLINRIKSAGYNIYSEFNTEKDLHNIYITLPSIPDLERRLYAKYLSHLGDYNITLISSTKK